MPELQEGRDYTGDPANPTQVLTHEGAQVYGFIGRSYGVYVPNEAFTLAGAIRQQRREEANRRDHGHPMEVFSHANLQ
jgi:hypothetical protein